MEIVQLLSEATNEDRVLAHFHLGQMYFHGNRKQCWKLIMEKQKNIFEFVVEKLPHTHYIAIQSNSILQEITINELPL